MKLIATHTSTDFDAFSATVAVKKLYPDAKIVLPTSLNKNVKEFIILHSGLLPKLEDPSLIDYSKVSTLIMVDTRIYKRLGLPVDLTKKKDIQLLSYDHHKKSPNDARFESESIKNLGSTTTIILDELIKKDIRISRFEATLFALGIYEDTGSLSYSNTTPKDAQTVAYLLGKKADLKVINRFLSFSLTKEQHSLLERLILSYKKVKIYDKAFLLANTRTDVFIEGLSIVTKKISQIEDVDVAFCWVRMKDKTYLVGRSSDPEIDVSKILAPLGGGGHPQAASAVLSGIDAKGIENSLTKNIKSSIKGPLRAKDIMSYPVRSVKENTSVAEVLDVLKKYGHSGIPIVDKQERLVGIITRKDLDKAVKHGLSHAPVKGFRSHGIITAKPGSTIYDIRKMMVENGIGRVPVTEKDKIIGIVTRKDVLRHVHGEDFFESQIYTSLSREDLKDKIDSYFPQKYKRILKTASRVSRQMGFRVFLVGGIVRDMILGKDNLDIDLVIEGDGIAFANTLAKKINAKSESHSKFHTAVIILPDKNHIDIATSRIEYYEKPAALPSVETGSIRQDLARRDFTINAMAVSLNREDFGELLDYFGGLKDIHKKKIRVLHKLSFIEDPTRVFRAVRFEQRYGFTMDKQTDRLMGSPTVLEAMSDIIGARLRDELVSIMNEENPWKPLKRLEEIGALKSIGIDTKIDKSFIATCKKSLSKKDIYNFKYHKDIKSWHIILILFFMGKSLKSAKIWMLSMKFRKKDIDIILFSIKNHDKLKNAIKKEIKKSSSLYSLLSNVPLELLTILSSHGKKYAKDIDKYLFLDKNTKSSLDGDALKKMGYRPSKRFKEILDRLYLLRLDGVIKSREQEIKEVKKYFKNIA